MKCPACKSSMRRTRYEEVPIECCDTCHGYLITTRRLDGIKRRRDKWKSELEQEAMTRAPTNFERKLKCPDCHKRMHHRTWEGVARLEVDLLLGMHADLARSWRSSVRSAQLRGNAASERGSEIQNSSCSYDPRRETKVRGEYGPSTVGKPHRWNWPKQQQAQLAASISRIGV